MLSYMGSTVEGLINLFRLYCMVAVTNIDGLKLCEIHIDLICPEKIWSVIILVIILKIHITMTRFLCQLQQNQFLNTPSMVLLSCL